MKKGIKKSSECNNRKKWLVKIIVFLSVASPLGGVYCQTALSMTPTLSKNKVKECQEKVVRSGSINDYNDLRMSWLEARENPELLIPYALILAIRYDNEEACGEVFWLVEKYYKEQQMEMDVNMMAFLLVLLEKGVALGSEDCARYLADLYLKEEYLPRDTVLAVSYLEEGAGLGNSLLYRDLYELYMKGEYVQRGMDKAVEYLEKGANAGNYICISELASMYLKGENVTQDTTKAIYFLEKGIEKDVSNCFYDLGVMYIRGEFVQQDITKGLAYLEEGAERNSVLCLRQLHDIYKEGKYVQQDIKRAENYERKRWKIMTKGH